MASRVIQGFFIGGRPRVAASMAPLTAMPRWSGPPVPAFAGRQASAQPKVGARPPGQPIPAFAARPPVAQAHGPSDSFQVDSARLGLASGGGRKLPDAVRGQMEAALGANFSGVRVHVGPQAERIGAVAFTLGTDIYFAPGRYQPDTVQGQQLLGHELAHVVQQREGRVRNPLGSGIAVVQDRALEAEADRLGSRAAIPLRRTQTKPVLLPSGKARQLRPATGDDGAAGNVQAKMSRGSKVAQRYCSLPGCNDPNCRDERNHAGMQRVYNLRGRDVRVGEFGPADIGQGTGTNQAVRTYVNDPNTTYPVALSISHPGGGSSYQQPALLPGQRAQAGHSFGAQYGGIGTDPALMIPQHPNYNMGTHYNGVSTRPDWRQTEDDIRASVAVHPTPVTVTAYNVPRPQYNKLCPTCHAANPTTLSNCIGCNAPI